jgi:hypothetical protein
MIPTKTYPLSAIMGNQLTDKERIAELEAQNKTLRAAQKACEFCDEAVEGKVAQLERQLAALQSRPERRKGERRVRNVLSADFDRRTGNRTGTDRRQK